MGKLFNDGLIVSCQALKDEPMYGGDSVAKMAVAGMQGGAVGIRSNSITDINKISRFIQGKLPIIGLIKKVYKDSNIYITPTLTEVKALIGSKCQVIALDMTCRKRPKGQSIEMLIDYIRANSDKLIMADIATLEEAIEAERLGVDFISSTLRGYTEQTKGIAIPDMQFMSTLFSTIKKSTLIAEGGINCAEHVDSLLEIGYKNLVIGGAITRPKQITEYYVARFN